MHWLVVRKEWLTVALAVAFVAASIDAVDGFKKDGSKGAQAELKILVDPILRFGSKLLKSMGAERENAVFSPMSIHSALSMVLLGAKSGSETEKELLMGLTYGPCELEANKLFEAYAKLIRRIKRTVGKKSKMNKKTKLDVWTMAIARNLKGDAKRNYQEATKQYFRSSFRTLQGNNSKEINELAGEINKWGKEASFGDDLVKPEALRGQFGLMLLSAVRLEAYWFRRFAVVKRKEGLFRNFGQELVNGTGLQRASFQGHYVEFRQNTSSQASASSESFKELVPFDFYAADIQLKGGVSFATFMPATNGPGKLGQLERQLLSADENGMLTLCKTFQVLDNPNAKTVFRSFTMPQFQISANVSLIEQLKSMSIRRVFDQKQAELSRMHKSKLHVDKIVHKAVIEVNERGLRAAGSSEVDLEHVSSMKTSEVDLKLNRPFLFVVRYNRVPMFLGHLVKI